jgi:hypothetical protein
MAGLQISSVFGNFNSKNLTQATYVLQDRLEVLESALFDSLQFGEHNDGPVTMSGIDFNRAYTVVINGDLIPRRQIHVRRQERPGFTLLNISPVEEQSWWRRRVTWREVLPSGI